MCKAWKIKSPYVSPSSRLSNNKQNPTLTTKQYTNPSRHHMLGCHFSLLLFVMRMNNIFWVILHYYTSVRIIIMDLFGLPVVLFRGDDIITPLLLLLRSNRNSDAEDNLISFHVLLQLY